MIDWNSSDWTDESLQVSKHFKLKELLWLPTWGRMANTSDGLSVQVLTRLETLALTMDQLLDELGWSANVHCCWRPLAYNTLPSIGGAKNSAHVALYDHVGNPLADDTMEAAMDWNPIGMSSTEDCAKARQTILDQGLLVKLGLRMENRAGPWLHCDNRKPSAPGHEFFIP